MLEHSTIPETIVNNFVSLRKQGFDYDSYMEPKIREYLLEKQAINDWKQDEMAALMGVPKGTLSKWLAGSSLPDYDSMVKIAKAFDVPFQEVVDAREGHYNPISKGERDALIIKHKYTAESIILAFIETLQGFDKGGNQTCTNCGANFELTLIGLLEANGFFKCPECGVEENLDVSKLKSAFSVVAEVIDGLNKLIPGLDPVLLQQAEKKMGPGYLRSIVSSPTHNPKP